MSLRRGIGLGLTLAFILSGCYPGTKPMTKIGLVAPFTGFDEAVGYSVLYSAKLALQERNSRGGVSGYMVELVALDDRNQADLAVQRAQMMALDADIMGVIGHYENAAALAASEEYHRAGLTYLAVSATADELTRKGYPEVFRLCPPGRSVIEKAARFMAQERPAGLAVIWDADFRSDAQALISRSKSLGGNVVYGVEVSRWQLDYRGILHELAGVKPQMVCFLGRAAEGGAFLKRARDAGLDFRFLGGPGTDDPRLAEIAGSALEGAFYLSLFGDVKDERFLRGFRELASRPVGEYSAATYDATNVLLEAMERAIRARGRPEREAIRREVSRTTGYQGLTGVVSFDARGDVAASSVYLFQVCGGRFPGQPAGAP